MLPTTLTKESVSVVAEYFGLTDLVEELAPSPTNTAWPEVVTLDVRGRKINVNRLSSQGDCSVVTVPVQIIPDQVS